MNDKELLEELIKESDKDSRLTPKQTNILQAAIKVFAEKGYAATSTKEIANLAEVAEGTIFRYYKTKKDLLLAIVSPMITKFAIPFFADRFVQDVFEEQNSQSYEDLLRKLLKNRFEFAKQNSEMLKILLQEVSFQQEIQELFQSNFQQKIYPEFVQVIEEFQSKGEITNHIRINTAIRLMMTVLIGFIITRFVMVPNADWDDEYEIEQTIQFIRKGLS